MAFDLDTWKATVRERLQDWQPRLAQVGVNAVYGSLAATALWPVIGAAGRGEWTALGALFSVAGGVGGNLLAEQMQRWQDRANTPGAEAELAVAIEREVATRPELRDAVDTVLERLEVIPLAREQISAVDQEWLVEALRETLDRLGNLQRFEAQLSGSGALASGPGAKAASERGVAAETVTDSTLITGDSNRLVTAGTYVERQEIVQDPAEAKAERAERRYLQRLAQRCTVLPLAALGGEEGTGDEITLDKVYVDLDTQTRVPLTAEERAQLEKEALYIRREDRPLTALEAATRSRRLVLLGDPGSGKSTFVRQLAAWLAPVRWGEREPLPGWESRPLPLFVLLRDLAPRLVPLELDGLAAERRDRVLAEAVRQQWLEEPGAAELAEGLEDALISGQVALFFDGLDEVPTALRPRVRQAVQAVVREYPRVERVVVTSRIRSYVGEAVLASFDSHTLAPFDEAKIRAFVCAWYRAQAALGRLTDEMAGKRADDLTDVATSDDLNELASNPMLLTTMAIIHQREVGLPRERVRLYSLAVQVLLSNWQQHKGIGVSERLAALLRDDLKLRAILERLAYAAHERQAPRGEVTDLPRGDLLILLEGHDALGDPGLADEFLDYIDQRAGLLVGRGGDEPGVQPPVYTFPHRSFQEYLAGCRMVAGRGTPREYWRRAGEGDVWYLAARLGSEELLYNRRNTQALLDLAYALCPENEPATAQEWRAALWSGQMALVLGEEEIRRDTAQPGGGDSYLQRLVPRLARALHTDALAAIERADAGRALAQLGDPRREAVTVEGMEFCYIPGGTFVMGSGEDDPDAWDDEKPQHACGMPNGYWLGRYPVTVAQYQAFVVGGGYSEGRYWAEAERAGVWHDGLVKGWLDDTERSGPADYGEPFSLPNHPVVGVTWYEALAFTRWLGAWLREGGGLPEGWEVTLPSEAEWELAARGAEMIPLRAVAATPAESLTASPSGELEPNPQPRRRFPWGDEASAERANYAATGIGTTSAVGCFPGGASVYGVEELSGNVWEWTRSVWGPYPSPAERPESRTGEDPERMFEHLVLRGGAFFSAERYVRCAARGRINPVLRVIDVGFRVAVSPSTSGL